MTRFRSKPVEIEAVQWFKDGDHPGVVAVGRNADGSVRHQIHGAQGFSDVNPADWIIAEPRGDGFYPCNPEVFAAKYEPVDEPPEAA